MSSKKLSNFSNQTVPKTMIVGANGYIGSHLHNHFKKLHPKTIGTSRNKDSNDYLDLLNPCISNFDLSGYKYAIICGAIPNILVCEENPKLAYQINVLGPLKLAEKFLERGITPVFFSSDVVFDGTQNEYDEDSDLSPINEYGKHKALLEQQVPRLCGNNYLILRITKTYSKDQVDHTFIFDLASKLLRSEPLKAASDLMFHPLLINDLINTAILLLTHHKRGLYNICSNELTSWHKLATKLSKRLEIDHSENLIEEVSINDLNPNVKRAKNLNLSSNKVLEEFPNFRFTSLDESLSHITTRIQNEKLSCRT